jgi:hypothetical protein
MNKEIPVIDIMDYSGVTIDAVKWENNLYTIMFNFWKNIDLNLVKKLKSGGEDDTGTPDEGMVLCTHIEGRSLEECWSKVQLVLQSQILEGTDIFLWGNLWTHDGECLHDIDWTDYCDSETTQRLLGESIIEQELQKYSPIMVHPISPTIH